jgi:hypothetical protein
MQSRSGHSSHWRQVHGNTQLQSETAPRTCHTIATSPPSEPNIQGFAEGSRPQGPIQNPGAFNNTRMAPSSPRIPNNTGLLGYAEQPPVYRNNHVRRYGPAIHTSSQVGSQSSHDSERPDTNFKSRIRRALAPFSASNFDERQLSHILAEVKSILEAAKALSVAEPAKYNSEYRTFINVLVYNMAANFSTTDFEKSAYDDII